MISRYLKLVIIFAASFSAAISTQAQDCNPNQFHYKYRPSNQLVDQAILIERDGFNLTYKVRITNSEDYGLCIPKNDGVYSFGFVHNFHGAKNGFDSRDLIEFNTYFPNLNEARSAYDIPPTQLQYIAPHHSATVTVTTDLQYLHMFFHDEENIYLAEYAAEPGVSGYGLLEARDSLVPHFYIRSFACDAALLDHPTLSNIEAAQEESFAQDSFRDFYAICTGEIEIEME